VTDVNKTILFLLRECFDVICQLSAVKKLWPVISHKTILLLPQECIDFICQLSAVEKHWPVLSHTTVIQLNPI